MPHTARKNFALLIFSLAQVSFYGNVCYVLYFVSVFCSFGFVWYLP
jgi:hypothetical protein